MQAELIGLFVEDVDLIHFAGLPFASEVGYVSAARRTLDVNAMERSLRALAREAHDALRAAAVERSARWSFRVTRGSAPAELLAAAQDADLVILGLPPPEALARGAGTRVVPAGDVARLRDELQGRDGVLVLAGPDRATVAATLRSFLEEQD
jgi:hypothetical protein